MWKQENAHPIENPEEFNEKDFKNEEIQDEELEEDNSETEDETQDEELNEDNFESESELQPEEKPKGEPEDHMIHINAKQHNQDLRFKWYRKSIHSIPDKFKLQYVQANANRRNQETIFEWYKECEKIGLCEFVVKDGNSREKAEEIAHTIAKFPQECVKADRNSILNQNNLSLKEGLYFEWNNSIQNEVLAKEGIEGAGSFSKGRGRHGSFEDI